MPCRLKKYLLYSLIILNVFLLSRCAKIGAPTGGPKDVTPPRVVESNPENYAVNYNKENISITFDEFIQLKNINNELLVSPPLKELPDARMRNKTLVVDLNNELKDSTTYTLYFGNSITDLNEGNVLANFEFVFSTGDHIDSMSVTGNLVDAYDLKPPKDPVYVMLYDNLNDSAPMLEIPSYIGKTDKNGNFEINNVKTGKFRIFALKDGNSDLKYDLPSEAIAFIDSTFDLYPGKFSKEDLEAADSMLKAQNQISDSLSQLEKNPNDTSVKTGIDTTRERQRLRYALHVNLFMFTEAVDKQYIVSDNRPDSNQLSVIFNRPLYDSLVIKPLNFKPSGSWFISEKNPENDSLLFWITDSTISKEDTLQLGLQFTVKDSLQKFQSVTDTVNFISRETTTSLSIRRNRRNISEIPEKQVKKSLPVTINTKSAVFELNNHVTFETANPVFETNPSLIHLYILEDSVKHPVDFKFIKDSVHLRRFYLENKWQEDTRYELLAEPGAFTDIYGLSSDTIQSAFKTQRSDAYGSITFRLSNVPEQLIVQLLNQNGDKLIRQQITSKDGSMAFDFLKPGTYTIKVIFDTNKNGKWDTGNYLKDIQPEKVLFHKGTTEVRSNWDMDIGWRLPDISDE